MSFQVTFQHQEAYALCRLKAYRLRVEITADPPDDPAILVVQTIGTQEDLQGVATPNEMLTFGTVGSPRRCSTVELLLESKAQGELIVVNLLRDIEELRLLLSTRVSGTLDIPG